MNISQMILKGIFNILVEIFWKKPPEENIFKKSNEVLSYPSILRSNKIVMMTAYQLSFSYR